MTHHITPLINKRGRNPFCLFAATLLLTSGCGIGPRIAHPLPGVPQEGTPIQAVAQCEAKFPTSTFREQLALLQDSSKTMGESGQHAGHLSDQITRSDATTGADIGRSTGEIAGMMAGMAALYQEHQARNQAVETCLNERGYTAKEQGAEG